jgi:hypothetical protein
VANIVKEIGFAQSVPIRISHGEMNATAARHRKATALAAPARVAAEEEVEGHETLEIATAVIVVDRAISETATGTTETSAAAVEAVVIAGE